METIPKVIHQTVGDKSSLHPELVRNIEAIQSLNPDYLYRLYDNADVERFIKSQYSTNVLRYFHQINPVYGPARADFFRYLLMYREGGIYLDVKSTLTVPLSQAITSPDYLLSHWRNGHGERYFGWGVHPEFDVMNEFQQWHIVAPPNHPFLKAVIGEVMWNIDNYAPDVHGVGKIGVLRVTGPIAYTQAIAPLRSSYRHQVVDIEQLGFRYSIAETTQASLAHESLFQDHYHHIRPLPVVLSSHVPW